MTIFSQKHVMLKSLLVCLVGSAGALSQATAQDLSYSNPQYYVSGGIQRQWNKNAHARLNSVNLRLGIKPNRYYGFEVETAIGTGKDKSSNPEYGLSDRYGAYVVGFYPVTESLELIGRVGLASSRIKNHMLGDNVENGSSANVGVGAQFLLQDGFAVRFDYTYAKFSDDRGSADGQGISLVKSF